MGSQSYIGRGRGRHETSSSCVTNFGIPLEDVLKKRMHFIKLLISVNKKA